MISINNEYQCLIITMTLCKHRMPWIMIFFFTFIFWLLCAFIHIHYELWVMNMNFIPILFPVHNANWLLHCLPGLAHLRPHQQGRGHQYQQGDFHCVFVIIAILFAISMNKVILMLIDIVIVDSWHHMIVIKSKSIMIWNATFPNLKVCVWNGKAIASYFCVRNPHISNCKTLLLSPKETLIFLR